jgi:DNA-binding transcriptional LysR family regulator
MITFEQLEALKAIVRAGTFSRAAEDLYLTQPALSQRIKHLEQTLAVELFNRSHRGPHVELTLAGQATLEFANHVAAELQRLQRQLRGLSESPEREVLDVAVGPNAARHLLPDILPRFQVVCPDVRVNVVESIAFGNMLPNLVRKRTCELAITGMVQGEPRLKLLPLIKYHMVLIARDDHPIVRDGLKDEAELFRYPFAVLPMQADARRELERAAITAGTRLDVAVESYDFDVLRDAALRGLGLTIVPDLVLRDALSASHITTIQALGYPRDTQIYLFYDSERELSRAARAFLSIAPIVDAPMELPFVSFPAAPAPLH